MTQPGDFTQQADAYAQARPAYPEPLLDELIAHVGVRKGDPVADLGAGTGIFTAQLARRGFVVAAVEPNPAMRRHAPRLDGVTWVDGAFEATGLPDASQRWITAAQALHWADMRRTLPELRRVLEPGGHLTCLWNDRDPIHSELIERTGRIIRDIAPEFDELYRQRDWPAELTSTGDFTDVVHHAQPHRVPMSRDRYMTLWRSHNRLNVMVGPQRMAELLARIGAMLDEHDAEVCEVTYVCRAWTARRV